MIHFSPVVIIISKIYVPSVNECVVYNDYGFRLQEISAFRQLLHDPKIMKNPCAVITECVKERIVKEIKKK